MIDAENTPPATVQIHWCPACGRTWSFYSSSVHYARGVKCEASPIRLRYALEGPIE